MSNTPTQVAYITNKEHKILSFWCPACNRPHSIHYSEGGWNWNGSLHKPTLSPSLLVNPGQESPNVPQCHSFVTDGNIQFLSDCSHDKKGWNMEISAWPNDFDPSK